MYKLPQGADLRVEVSHIMCPTRYMASQVFPKDRCRLQFLDGIQVTDSFTEEK